MADIVQVVDVDPILEEISKGRGGEDYTDDAPETEGEE